MGLAFGLSLGEIFQAEALATRMSLVRAGMPLVSLSCPNFTWQAGLSLSFLSRHASCRLLLGIDPLDQPQWRKANVWPVPDWGSGRG